ncbi:hypothetical protein JDV02_004918 [Purpureocillium takamizusanense]|uniref:Uncharacterized protein n=1 Tax=Purpureocillium takamizusanense TaxID=2060973 RepID=A0A9Q8VB94_9HYPO|nr:uncharacterized protein JDV02_004918 [Purpureocillium takamizusanense]UNI18664.1 hypothetical protein JDV02_004918 [Purpureocillium takamizusanense]
MVARLSFCCGSGPGDLDDPYTQHCQRNNTLHALRPMASPSQLHRDAFHAGSFRYHRDVRGAPPTRALPALPVVEHYARPAPSSSFAPRPVKSYRPLPPIKISKFDVEEFKGGNSNVAAALQQERPDTSALLGFGPRGTLIMHSTTTPPPPPPLPPMPPFYDNGLPSPACSLPRSPAGVPFTPSPVTTLPLSAAWSVTDSGCDGSQQVEMIDVYMAPVCEICHQYDALSTGFCFRCEHLWQSAVTGCSTFIPRDTAVPVPDPAAVARASKQTTDAAAVGDARSSAWSSHVSSVLSLFGEEFDPGLPLPFLGDLPHYSDASSSLMVEPLRIKTTTTAGTGVKEEDCHPPTKCDPPVIREPASSKTARQCASPVTKTMESGHTPTKVASPRAREIKSDRAPTKAALLSGQRSAVSEPDMRPYFVPERLQKRSLIMPPPAFEPSRLSEAVRSLLPGAPTRKPGPRSAESQLYAAMSYYFEPSYFKRSEPIRVVSVRPVPPMVVQGLKKLIKGGARNWI